MWAAALGNRISDALFGARERAYWRTDAVQALALTTGRPVLGDRLIVTRAVLRIANATASTLAVLEGIGFEASLQRAWITFFISISGAFATVATSSIGGTSAGGSSTGGGGVNGGGGRILVAHQHRHPIQRLAGIHQVLAKPVSAGMRRNLGWIEASPTG